MSSQATPVLLLVRSARGRVGKGAGWDTPPTGPGPAAPRAENETIDSLTNERGLVVE